MPSRPCGGKANLAYGNGSPEAADRLQNGRGGFGPALRAAAFATRARSFVCKANSLRNQGMRLLISFKTS